MLTLARRGLQAVNSFSALRALPRRVWRRIWWITEKSLIRRGATSSVWCRLYYALFSDAYLRQQMAGLAGRSAYQRSLSNPARSMALLRRNVHRLEKGLVMRPRRKPFATDYIGETVKSYRIAHERGLDASELAWARDVLTEYFRVNAGVVELEAHRQRFVSVVTSETSEGPRLMPYCRDFSSQLRVDYDSLYQLARYRRSVRWFLQKPVPRESIDKAIELGAQAPTACNRQPFEFRVFDDPELVQKIIGIPYGLVGYGHNVPVIVVVVGRLANFFSEHDRHLIYIDASLAVMGFLLGLEVQGVSSCCVNWPDIADIEKRLAELLELGLDERPVMLVALGYPDPEGMVPVSAKKSLPTLRRYNFE